MSRKKDMLDLGLHLLKCMSEDVHSITISTIFFRIINTVVFTTVTLSTLVNFGYVENKQILKNLESFVTEFHIWAKYYLFILYRNLFATFMQDKKLFWKSENTKLRDSIDKIETFVTKFLQVLTFFAVCTVLSFFGKPITNAESSKILEGFVPNNYISETIIIVMQYYLLATGIYTAIGFDCIFIALCAHLIIQFKLLNLELQSLYMPVDCDETSHKEAQKKLKKCVQHHQFLIKFFANLRTAFSLCFIAQYFTTMITICMELYMLSSSKEEFSVELLKTLFYISTILTQFGIYCIAAQYVVDEILNLSNGIYNSKWFLCKVSYQKDLTFIMIKTQTQARFTAGGLIEINIQTFASVIKTAFSFFTIMRSLFD